MHFLKPVLLAQMNFLCNTVTLRILSLGLYVLSKDCSLRNPQACCFTLTLALFSGIHLGYCRRAIGQHLSYQNCFYPSDIAIPLPCGHAHVWLCVCEYMCMCLEMCKQQIMCICMYYAVLFLKWINTCLCAWV